MTVTLSHARSHPRSERSKYLFIRVQEACNADCFFCEFALSKDPYRFPLSQMEQVAVQARELGVGVIRFTGGEPLMHPQVVELVRACAAQDHEVSMITNGVALARRADELVDAGLSQVVISLDSPDAEVHDTYRRTPKLFERAMEGIHALRGRVLVRVNTVVGPHNVEDMPRMQRVLEEAGVAQWELSPIKLARPVRYPDPAAVVERCASIYDTSRPGALVPMGEPFYGATPQEQEAYFSTGQVPRPKGPVCHVTDDVRFLDPKNGQLFACSLLPHRDPTGIESGATGGEEGGTIDLESPSFRRHRDHFRDVGPQTCQGCSTTAAGYSNTVERTGGVPTWSY